MEFMRWIKRLVVGIVFVTSAAFVLMLIIYNFPQPFFTCRTQKGNLALYSDRPFAANVGNHILALVDANLRRSPLYSSRQRHRIFICNSKWRRSVFFAISPQAGGGNCYPFTSNIFFNGARVENNQLISPSGRLDRLHRTLDHFIAHEITHTLTGHAIGPWRYKKLPAWLKEGYAEYIGAGPRQDYVAASNLFMANAQEMNWPPFAVPAISPIGYASIGEKENSDKEFVMVSFVADSIGTGTAAGDSALVFQRRGLAKIYLQIFHRNIIHIQKISARNSVARSRGLQG
jgi:hypothetical protein